MVLKEFCAEGYNRVPEAINAGAKRIELCARLEVGGVTPSTETIKKTVDYCHSRGIPVMVIIRCREGNFCYNDAEFQKMKESVDLAKSLKADGVVLGALDASGNVDERISLLLSSAEGMSLTFHMAFDEVPREKQFEVIDILCKYKFHRILTHGGPSSSKIEDNLDRLAELVAYAGGRISIMPGGGVTSVNAKAIVDRLGVTEVHGTRIVSLL
ncbi:copper homeostasis protein [Trypanosoma theileri]|uniref:Copper homeostasis protein cutC homolog n=1 Tax=Trypanosoma theileri TaxID=67003 RepID=A0A1X0NIR8_9TRYP|nr:copper homeostasis protein [Trypanosoma theileri]ORC84625.1 copper homeostasis protein [Trypanosoma theileri]